MTQEYLTLKNISEKLNIPASTCRLWRDKFEEYLPYKGKGRKRRYHKDAVPLFRHISKCYALKTS